MTAHAIKDEDLIAAALSVALIEYCSVLTTEQHTHGSDLPLNHLEEAMHQIFHQFNLEKEN